MKNFKTLSYVYGTEETIKVGGKYYFGQLWDGEGNGLELLESGVIAVYDETGDFIIVDFDVEYIDFDEIMESVVKVTGC